MYNLEPANQCLVFFVYILLYNCLYGIYLNVSVSRFRFYKRNSDVTEDYELQNLINELSADGKIPPYNGMGQVS